MLSVINKDQIILEKQGCDPGVVLRELSSFASVRAGFQNLIELKYSPYLFYSSLYENLYSGRYEQADFSEKICQDLFGRLKPFLKYPLPSSFSEFLKSEIAEFKKLSLKKPFLWEAAEKKNRVFEEVFENASVDLKSGQKDAVKTFFDINKKRFYGGIISLPGGYGKTITGGLIAGLTGCRVLVLVHNKNVALHWERELEEKCGLEKDHNFTVLTFRRYQSLLSGTLQDIEKKEAGGIQSSPLMIDEVHKISNSLLKVLPENVPVWGLSATPSMDHLNARDLISKIGPLLYNKEKKQKNGFYFEIPIKMPESLYQRYMINSSKKSRYKIASCNPDKIVLLKKITDVLKALRNRKFIVFSHYIEQVREAASVSGLPFLTGRSSASAREKVYQFFREGKIQGFVTSGVTNEAIDLPDANTIIELSESYEHDDEKYQRWGRLLREKQEDIVMISLVTLYSDEEVSALSRRAGMEKKGITTAVKNEEGILTFFKNRFNS